MDVHVYNLFSNQKKIIICIYLYIVDLFVMMCTDLQALII